MKRIIYAVAIVATTIFTGCAKRTVTRVSPDQQIDLSGRWNDTDAKLVAEEMVGDILKKPWLEAHRKQTNDRPVVIVGYVKNKSSEHIEDDVFIKELEKVFVNSGQVRLVQNDDFREKIRRERGDQQEFADPATAKRWKKELGADYMLFGTITSVTDQINNKKVVSYKVNLSLSHLETNEVVWINDKEIKKYIKN